MSDIFQYLLKINILITVILSSSTFISHTPFNGAIIPKKVTPNPIIENGIMIIKYLLEQKFSGSLQNPQIKTTSTNKAPIAHINDTSDIVRIEKLFKDFVVL